MTKDIFSSNFIEEHWIKISFAMIILIIALLIFFFYAKIVGILFLLLTWFVFLTFVFNVPWKERFLAGLLAISLFWWDILQNKVTDLGLNYRVTIATGITMKAITQLYIAFFTMFIILAYLVIFAVTNDKGNRVLDIVIGVVGVLLFGVGYALYDYVKHGSSIG